MDEPRRVRLGQRAGDRNRHGEHVAHAHARARNPLVERLALHQFHRDELDAAVAADVEHGDDVRVVERGGGARLLREPAPGVVVQAASREEGFQRDVAVQPGVAGAIDLAHASGAERLEDLIRAESCAWRKCHNQAGRD